MTRTKRALRLIGSALFLTLLLFGSYAEPLMAQGSGTISGTVVASDGPILPGVTIEVRNVATGTRRLVVTNRSGAFTITGLPPGTYA
ncbi:MAG TPA: carboxypeptidase-like regulatory domain-containing protein, partial [Thermoanaerobaculia bacterium]|nr:carboxypeptidase-like regulatory domain-containing protein [Thermoanaerobaculia bacterium]